MANAVDSGALATDNIFADGRMGWDAADAWADALSLVDSVRGVTWDDWRLPLTSQPDPSCDGLGRGCIGSEMGHLFNVDGIMGASPGLFTNVQSFPYWSGSEFAPGAWAFNFGGGDQTASGKQLEAFVWAVRPCDVETAATVPEPATTMLLGASLIGFAAARHRARRPGASLH